MQLLRHAFRRQVSILLPEAFRQPLPAQAFGTVSIEPSSPVPGIEASRVWSGVLPEALLEAVAAEAASYHKTVVQEDSPLPISSQVTRWIDADARPRFAIEAAIQILQGLVRRQSSPNDSWGALAGAEWWVQRRPVNDTLDFHFDVDSCLLHTDRRLRCPSASSVFYLTESGGPTAVLDQKAAEGLFWGSCLSPESATRCDLLFPRRNQYAVFPGRFLHGVLPDLATPSSSTPDDNSTQDGVSRGVAGASAVAGSDGPHEEEMEMRTTLLVNWWFGSRPAGPCCSPVSDDMAMSLREAGSSGGGGDSVHYLRDGASAVAASLNAATEERMIEFDINDSSQSSVEVESEMLLMGGGLVPVSFLIPDQASPTWQERLNTAVTGMDHARRIRTAYDA